MSTIKGNEFGNRDGELTIVNRPHIQRVLKSKLITHFFFHAQNLCWTLERTFGLMKEGNVTSSGSVSSNPIFLEKNRDLILSMAEASDRVGRQNSPENIAIIIPSRLLPIDSNSEEKTYHIQTAIRSVEKQVCDRPLKITFIIGVDADTPVPTILSSRSDVIIARSEGKSQILALNAAIQAAGSNYNYVAFLEDDDYWDEKFLFWTLLALEKYDFVSTNQIEADETGRVIYINDFATPSGWLMPMETLQKVGPINPRSKWHYDNEWLGRFSKSGLRRCHLVNQ